VRKWVAAAIALFTVFGGGLAYWQYSQRQQVATSAPPPAPPPQVGVVAVSPKAVPLKFTYAGRVAGYRDVEIRAQVSGTLLKREFSEGARVKEGDVLFRIDPKPYQVALERAKAQLAQAEATLRQNSENWKRIDELLQRKVATEKQHDEARAAFDQSRATVQLSQAEVHNAELNLGYTTITSPVSGVTRLLSPPEGSLVLAQQTILTTITQLDPAYVNFSFTDAEYQAARELSRRLPSPIEQKDLTVELHYGDGTRLAGTGRIDVSANRVDAQTGTIQARAIFSNQDGTALLPGQFVRIIITGVTLPNAIVVPSASVSQGAQGPFVYVVGQDSKAEARPLKLGREVDEGWVVENGLSAGDTLIVDGLMRIRPGAPVAAVPAASPRDGNAPRAGDRP